MTSTPAPAVDMALGALEPGNDGAYVVAGRRVAMPVQVRHATMAAATFLVPADAAQSVIAGTGLRVAAQRGGRAVVALALVRYLDNDLGDYDELGLTFVVDQPEGQPPLQRGAVATYIHRLPVDQAFTCEAGRGIWGFPKWVADLSVVLGGGVATASLRDDKGDVAVEVYLRGPGVPVPSRSLTMVCYSNDAAGGLLRTEWTTDNRHTRVRPGPRAAQVTVHPTSDDPFAADLRALGFPRRSLLATSATMRATFSAPTRL